MKIINIFIFCLLTVGLFAQNQSIFNSNNKEIYTVKYSSDPSSVYKNQIINKIAVNIPKSVYNTQFTITYLCNKTLTKNGNQLDFQVTLSGFEFSGDCTYKGFPLNDALIPENASAKIKWITNINQVLETFEFDNLIISGDPVTLINYMHTDTLNLARYKFEVSDLKLKYTRNSVNKVNDRCFVIDDLYNTDTQMQIAYSELQTIDLNNLDMLFEYKKITDKNAQLIDIIGNKKFPEKLDLNKFDPINFQQKYSDLYQINSKLSIDIDNTIKNLYQIYYTKGLEFLSQGDLNNAELFFNKSINTNMMFAPAHYQLAKLLYNKQQYDDAIERVKDILYKMQPDPNTHNLTVDLANKIYSDYIEFASNYNTKSNYTQAIEILQKAESICNSISGVYCEASLNTEYTRAYHGQLNEYCSKAEKYISLKDYANAESTIATATLFVDNHSDYLKNAEILNNTNTSLYNSYINNSFNLLGLKKYNDALAGFEAANVLCLKFDFIECSEELSKGIYQAKYGIYQNQLQEVSGLISKDPHQAENLLNQAKHYRITQKLEQTSEEDALMKKIKYKIYKELIAKGKDLAISKLYDQSLESYNQAKNIEIVYLVKPDPNLDIYIKNTARALFFLNIENGNKKVSENNLKSAREFYMKSEGLMKAYPISKDNDVVAAHDGLKEKIFTQECKNAQSEYDDYMNKAMALIKDKKMINADEMLDKAIDVSVKIPECGIETTSASNKKKEILTGVIYQKKLIEVNKMEQCSEYQDAIDKYIEVEKYYNGNNVADLKINHVLLFDHISSSSNTRFLLFASKYYLDIKDFDKSLKILDKLKEKNYKKAYTKDVQILLGTQLALRDHKNEPNGIAKNMVLQYTSNDKWYKYLKKAYVNQSKKL